MNDSNSPASPAADAAAPAWAELVTRVQAGDDAAMEELYNLLGRGVRFHLSRQFDACDLEDRVHDTFLIVAHAIQKGELRDPDRLMGFIRTIVRRQVAAHVEQAVHNRRQRADLDLSLAVLDNGSDPEQDAIRRQRAELAGRVLSSVSTRDREIVTRFYLREQTQEEICREMNLTDTQFRLLKSRAKARFGELGKKSLVRRRFRFW